MPLLFKFLSLDVTRLHGQRGMQTLQGLDAGHLIGPRHMRTRRGEHRGGLIHLTHLAYLLSQFERIVGRWGKPIALTVRL